MVRGVPSTRFHQQVLSNRMHEQGDSRSDLTSRLVHRRNARYRPTISQPVSNRGEDSDESK